MELSKNELNNISGGEIAGYFILGGIFTFIVGFMDGFTRPLKCN